MKMLGYVPRRPTAVHRRRAATALLPDVSGLKTFVDTRSETVPWFSANIWVSRLPCLTEITEDEATWNLNLDNDNLFNKRAAGIKITQKVRATLTFSTASEVPRADTDNFS